MGQIALTDCDVSDEARQLISESLVWDMHGCMPLRGHDQEFLPQLQRYRAAGVDVCCLNIGFDVMPWGNAILVAANFRHYIRHRQDHYVLIETVADLDQARESNRLGVMFDLEGACALNDQLSMVQLYYDLGVRWMLFAYNKNNSLAGGCDDDDTGLTRFGREVLAEMKRAGMIVCCTHTGERTTMEVIERSENPVIFSHSNPRAIWDHYRNISDRAIKACAETGGVVSINGIGDFLGDNDNRSETVVEHIDYVAQLVGPGHVGLGLDYVFDAQELADCLARNPDFFPPEKYSDGINLVAPEQIPEIVDGLLNRGYESADIKKILGENHRRVAEQVWLE